MEDPRRIILVEDSPTQAIRMQHVLEQSGFEVTCAFSAEEALGQLNTARPDLMLVDYHLPGIQGDELCRRVRMNINTQGVPILMLTADADAETELHGLDAGADDYVAKSEDTEILMLRVNALLRKSKQRQDDLITAGDSFFRRARILAIDDSPTYLELLTAELIADGYEVETTQSAADGLERAAQETFDCVLVDLMMPDKDGFEVCREVTDETSGRDHPVVIVMVSAHESKENTMKALESGADDFVGKGSDLSVLKGRLRALLRHKFLHEQNMRIIEEFRKREDDLERTVEERTRELRNEIQDRRKAEEEARHAKEQADAANRAKTEFLANMSHELRTPLNAVIGFSDMIRNRVLGEIAEGIYDEYIENIYESGQHLLEIINDILDVSRIEVGKVKLNEEPVRLARVINATTRLIKEQAQKNQVSLVVDARDDGLPTIRADERLLKQALLNILSNAVKFTPEGGRVTLHSEILTDGRLAFGVTDTGIGIEDKDIELVLSPFGQVDSGFARRHQGTGLGLPLTKMFMELHGGTLDITSRIGVGTTVSLTIPPDRIMGEEEF